jgi:hypothetical protein
LNERRHWQFRALGPRGAGLAPTPLVQAQDRMLHRPTSWRPAKVARRLRCVHRCSAVAMARERLLVLEPYPQTQLRVRPPTTERRRPRATAMAPQARRKVRTTVHRPRHRLRAILAAIAGARWL